MQKRHFNGLFATSALIAAGLAAPALAQEKSTITVADIHKLADLSGPAFSPDGAYLAYTVSTHNLDKDKTVSDVWRVPFAGGEAHDLTNTPKTSEWQPQYTKDGKELTFLSDHKSKTKTKGNDDKKSKDEDSDTQVWIMPAKGGAPRQVTHIKGGVSDYYLSPDGTRLVAVAEVGKSVGFDGDTTPPIVIDRFGFKADGRYYLDDRRQQLFIVDVKTGKATQLTSGEYEVYSPAWSPDGKLISFVSNRTADYDRNLNFDVWVIAPEAGAEPRKIGDYAGDDGDPDFSGRPEWSPDSKKLVWLQQGADKWIYYSPFQLEVGDVETGETKDVARIDRWFYNPIWSPDGKSIYSMIEQDREMHLAKIDPETDKIDYLTSGERFGYEFALGKNGDIAILDGDANQPYQLRALTPEEHPLTHHNDWLKDRKLAKTIGISAKNGKEEIHGLVVLPPDYQPGKHYPTIVRVHGGPVYQLSFEFMFDWQVYAANGFVVVGPDPRGSSGRGFDFAKAIYADWGNVDVKDVHAIVDEAVKEGYADPDRLGVGGWSYGGIMTDYQIAADNRYKAAISGAGMANFLGGYGGDQYALYYELELGTPWGDTKNYMRVSRAFYNADKITTPTLFQCGTADFNVPCIGAEQMYQALKSVGVPTELVVYPGENHGLTTPSYLEDRMQRDLDWYTKYLKK